MKNLYLIMLLTISYSLSAVEQPNKQLGKQEHTGINERAYAEAAKNKEDGDKATENKDQKKDKKIEDVSTDLKVLDEKTHSSTTHMANDEMSRIEDKQNVLGEKNISQPTQETIEQEQHIVKGKKRPTVKKTRTEDTKNDKALKSWTELKKEPIKEWSHKETQDKQVHKRQYNDLNEHLPAIVSTHDYSKQFFYCIAKSDLLCMRAVVGKLEKVGLPSQEILELRNGMGDTPLIYAARQGGLDAVRFLLLQGADVNAVNSKFESALDVANKRCIINAITEMKPNVVEAKKINNQQNSDMYNWAISTKESNESKCS